MRVVETINRTNEGVILLFLFLFVSISIHAIDYRMSETTWTFDNVTAITQADQTQSLGNGIYYQGGPGSEIIELDSKQSGVFCDGNQWSTNKAIVLKGHTFEPSYLDGERRWASIYNENVVGLLAFNTTVSGTCYVVMKPKVTGMDAPLSIHCQYKGLNSDWTHKSFDAQSSDAISEIKLYCEAAGSFWINASQDTYVYAVRFVPDDIIELEKFTNNAQTLTRLSNGNWFADFGKDAFSQIELTLQADNDNDTVIVHLGECVKDGMINREPGGSRRYRTITLLLQKGIHTYPPDIPADVRNTKDRAIHMPMEIGEVMPFRYCEIEGYDKELKKNNISQLAVNYKFNDDASYFHCDNDDLNKVWEICKYSMKATSFSGYYVDGDRERIPYEADALINQLGHYANDCEFSIGRRTVDRLLRVPNGYSEWIMQTILVAYYDYLYSGDKTLITKYAEELRPHTMSSFVQPETGLVSSTLTDQTPELLREINRAEAIEDIVDWPHSGASVHQSPRGGEDDNFEYTDYNTVVNAYHYEAVKRMAQIYEALGRIEEQRELEKYCSDFKILFNNSFLDTEQGIYRDGLTSTHSSLHANMFALCFGLVPDGYKQSVADFITQKGMVCSVYGAQFLLDALYKSGKDEQALQLMINETERSWMNMIEKGATMTMEAWDDSFKPNQDWNHAWGAAPANIIPYDLIGIQPLKAGFAKAEIRPQIGFLSHVECKTPTVNGTICVEIDKSDSEVLMDVSIPNTIQCDLYVPIISGSIDSSYILTIDDNEQEKFTIENNFIKLTNVTGVHTIKLAYNSPTIVRMVNNAKKGSLDNWYSLAGQSFETKPVKKGIYIKDGIKIVQP